MSLSLLYFHWSNVFLFKGGQTNPQVLGWLFDEELRSCCSTLCACEIKDSEYHDRREVQFYHGFGEGGVSHCLAKLGCISTCSATNPEGHAILKLCRRLCMCHVFCEPQSCLLQQLS